MERWDIYDENRQLTGRTMQKNDWHMKPGEYHLTVLAVVMRPDGRFLITQRIGTKAWAPLWWEVPGGGVMAGETSLEAARRELLEETGIDAKDAKGGYLFSYKRENPEEGDNYFVDIYRFEMDASDEDVKLQEEESVAFAFADREQIRQLAAEGIFLHYDSIRQVFDTENDN